MNTQCPTCGKFTKSIEYLYPNGDTGNPGEWHRDCGHLWIISIKTWLDFYNENSDRENDDFVTDWEVL